MNVVEKVRQECKDRKIPVSKLERDCGFANGYIGSLKKGTIPADRLQTIADISTVFPVKKPRKRTEHKSSSAFFISGYEILVVGFMRFSAFLYRTSCITFIPEA